MQECVDLFQRLHCHLFDLVDSLSYHSGQLLPLVYILLLVQVESVEKDLHSLDEHLMRQLKVLVLSRHLEIGLNKLLECVDIVTSAYNVRQHFWVSCRLEFPI